MIYDFFNKKIDERPELAELLPEPFLHQWRERAAAGETRLRIKYSGFNGGQFNVSGYGPNGLEALRIAAGSGRFTFNGKAGDTSQEKADTSQAKPRICATPFKAFDERALKARAFLYANHYQRGEVTCSVGQDGAELTSSFSIHW